MTCFHCGMLDGAHLDTCATQVKAKCPPHSRGRDGTGNEVCKACGKLWDEIPKLYCIAYEYRVNLVSRRDHATIHNWKADFLYLHATSDSDARGQFFSSQSPHLHMRIVGVAPVLGYFVDDEHGENLSV